MKKLFTFIFIAVACSQMAAAQNFGIVLFEDFDATTTPTGWTQTTEQTFPAGISSTVPSGGWEFGAGVYTSTYWDVPASLDGSPFAISNDDPVDQNRLDDVLSSPIMNLASFDSAIFLYEVFYDSLYQASEGYFLISYDAGTSWLNLPLTATTLANGWVEDGILLPNTIVVGGTPYTFNDQMMIGFAHTDNGVWATGVAIDNVIVAGYNNPCDDIVTIPQCGSPQTVTLAGQGIIDFNFTTECLFEVPGAEQLYSFTPSVTGVHNIVVSSATETSYLEYLYKPASAGCDSLDWNCISDVNVAGTYGGLALTAGTEYYILVDNEFADSETQTFSIECPCTYTSGGNAAESESCGTDVNGGCLNTGTPTYEPIACGASISGTVWADAGNRDLDWFELVVTENTTIEVDFSGAPPMVASLSDACANTGTPLITETSLACGSGTLSYAVTPGTYVLALFPQTYFGYPCGSGANDYDVTVTYCEPPVGNPCTTAADTYGDLNNAGGAPCNDGNGCSTTDPVFSGFGVYGSEGYTLVNVQAGFDYVFDMCTGFGAGAWIPEITILAPDGSTIDAWNGDAATGSTLTFLDQCSLGWTASQSGTYTIIINELGTGAGDAPNQVDCNTSYAVDNGNPTVTCGTNSATCPPAPSNDECAGAIPLQVNSSCVTITGDVNLATESLVGCTGDALSDVWFSFVATSSDATVDVTGSANFDAVVEVFALSCGGASLDCEDGTLAAELETVPLSGLTVGMPYYIRVYDYYDNLFPLTTTFDICVYGSPITGISENEVGEVNVYPNPSNGTFTVELENINNHANLVVMDVTGRAVYSETVFGNGTTKKVLELDLNRGSYLLQVNTHNQNLVSKIVIQ